MILALKDDFYRWKREVWQIFQGKIYILGQKIMPGVGNNVRCPGLTVRIRGGGEASPALSAQVVTCRQPAQTQG